MTGWIRTIEENRRMFVDVVRMYLGAVLLFKGVYFISDIDKLMQLIGIPDSQYTLLAVAHYIVFAHIVGGLFLMIGLLTRVVVLFQMPILLGAVFLVHFKEGMFGQNASLEYALLVLILLVAFSFYGSGRLSADYYLESRRERMPGEEDETVVERDAA